MGSQARRPAGPEPEQDGADDASDAADSDAAREAGEGADPRRQLFRQTSAAGSRPASDADEWSDGSAGQDTQALAVAWAQAADPTRTESPAAFWAQFSEHDAAEDAAALVLDREDDGGGHGGGDATPEEAGPPPRAEMDRHDALAQALEQLSPRTLARLLGRAQKSDLLRASGSEPDASNGSCPGTPPVEGAGPERPPLPPGARWVSQEEAALARSNAAPRQDQQGQATSMALLALAAGGRSKKPGFLLSTRSKAAGAPLSRACKLRPKARVEPRVDTGLRGSRRSSLDPRASGSDGAEPSEAEASPKSPPLAPPPAPPGASAEAPRAPPPEPADPPKKGKGKGKGPPPPPKAKAPEAPPEKKEEPEQKPPEKGKGKKGPAPPAPKAEGPAEGAGKAKGKGKAPPPKAKAAAKAPPTKKDEEEGAHARRQLAKLKPLGWQKILNTEGTIWGEEDNDADMQGSPTG
ncbi:unnamed protein product [Prorocentrum cordatum]|uniref:Uncharacterized protein n=1 Tax=Prorocentrum cordatum TaxID=2364126 RepID=A0ABN9XDV2_9DINO|nr:unnamed protein product [Polarella glacialis]